MKSDFVFVKDLAVKAGMDRSSLRRYMIKNGIKFKQIRDLSSKNQLTLAVTKEEAEFILSKRESEGYGSIGKVVTKDVGHFYIVAICPDLDKNRIKFGYTDDMMNRMNQYKTIVPTSELLSSWPSKRVWEQTAIDILSCNNCKLILNEVYECENIDSIIETGNKLFEMLPDPNIKIALSEYSPIKRK